MCTGYETKGVDQTIFAVEGNREDLGGAGYRVDDFANGYLGKVTDYLQDVDNDFAAFSLRRANCKAMYRHGLFRIEEEPTLGRP